MLIDTSTLIQISLPLLTTTLTAILSVYLTSKDIPKKRCYILISIIAVFILGLLFVFRFWDVVLEKIGVVPSVAEKIMQSTQSGLNNFVLSITNFTDQAGFILLLSFEIVPWISFFLKLNWYGNKNNVFTQYGNLFFSIVLPLTIVVVEVIAAHIIFNFLYHINASVYILWIMLVSLLIHIISLEIIFGRFSSHYP